MRVGSRNETGVPNQDPFMIKNCGIGLLKVRWKHQRNHSSTSTTKNKAKI